MKLHSVTSQICSRIWKKAEHFCSQMSNSVNIQSRPSFFVHDGIFTELDNSEQTISAGEVTL